MTTPADDDRPENMVSNGQTWSTGQSVNNPLSWADIPPVEVGTLWSGVSDGVPIPIATAGPRVDLGNGMSRELISADVDGERWETWAYRARRGDVLVMLPVAGAELADPATAAAYDDMMRTALDMELDRRTGWQAGGVAHTNGSDWQSTSTEFAGDCDIAATAVWTMPTPDPTAADIWRSLLDDPPPIVWLPAGPLTIDTPSETPAWNDLPLRQARYRLRWQMATPDVCPDAYTGDLPNRPADQVPADAWHWYEQHHIDGGVLLEQWAQLHQMAAGGEYIRDVHMFERDPAAPDGWREIDAGGPTP